MGKYNKIRKYVAGGPLLTPDDPIQKDHAMNQTWLDQANEQYAAKANQFTDNQIKSQIRENIKQSFLQSEGVQMFQNLGTFIKADPLSYGAAAAGLAVDTATNALVGNKNFNEESQAADELASSAATAVSQFGPWGQVAALGIKAINAADKIAGQTVPGYKVDMTSSGFGGIQAETDDKSNRLSQMGNLDKQMERRNQQATMALAAAQLDKDNDFMMEARGNSINDVMNRNKNALDGGLGLDTLGA